jgi:O-antigen ligase
MVTVTKMFKSSRWRIIPRSESVPFLVLVGFLALTFFMGGSARQDVQSLVVLRPAALMVCGVALWSLTRSQVMAYRFLFGMLVAVLILVSIHLVPLPPAIWANLPGRAVIGEIDRVAGLREVWRPVSMVPASTWNAFYSIFVPAAVLLLGAQLSSQQKYQLLPVLLGLGLLSGFWGMLQTIGNPQGPLYLYRITNNGSAVGLFANRNHQAILLATLFPMLAVNAVLGVRTEEQAKVRAAAAGAAGVVLIPLLLITGSRAGLILGVVGLAAAGMLYRKPRTRVPRKRKIVTFAWHYPLIAFGVLCLTALTVILSRAEALQRLASPDQAEEQRFQVWGPIAAMAWKYFPVGSGVGTFVEVYQIDEPILALSPNYLNHAHNDWLELYMTAGLPGLILLAVALLGFARASLWALRSTAEDRKAVTFARLGSCVVGILALGSLGDYPLRTPSLACVFLVGLIWLTPTQNSKGLEVSRDIV